MKKHQITLYVNEKEYTVLVEPRLTLADLLREQLHLAGTKKSCNKGECGACSVIMDGKLVLSCLILAVAANGSRIQTIEGVGTVNDLHPLQDAFLEEGAVQCGYCTPAMILAAKALLDQNPSPTEHEVRQAISGNLCRCTGYHRIVQGVLRAADKINAGGAK